MIISIPTEESWEIRLVFDRNIAVYRDECEVEESKCRISHFLTFLILEVGVDLLFAKRPENSCKDFEAHPIEKSKHYIGHTYHPHIVKGRIVIAFWRIQFRPDLELIAFEHEACDAPRQNSTDRDQRNIFAHLIQL